MKIKILLLLLLFFLLTSCLNITMSYRINESGKVVSKVNYTASNEYGTYMIPSMYENLINEGYTVTHYTGKSVEGFLYTDTSNILSQKLFEGENQSGVDASMMKFDNESKSKNMLFKKSFIFDHRISKYPDDSFSGSSDDYGAMMGKTILSMFNVAVIITVPGEITETNGNQLSENTVRWEYNLLELLQNGGRIYLKSVIDNSPSSILSADKNARKKIMKIQTELDESNFKIMQYKKMIKNESAVNINIEKEIKQSDKILTEYLNTLILIFNEEYKRFPSSIDEIKTYNKKIGFGNIIIPSKGTIIYNNENHKIRIEE